MGQRLVSTFTGSKSPPSDTSALHLPKRRLRCQVATPLRTTLKIKSSGRSKPILSICCLFREKRSQPILKRYRFHLWGVFSQAIVALARISGAFSEPNHIISCFNSRSSVLEALELISKPAWSSLLSFSLNHYRESVECHSKKTSAAYYLST